MRPEPSPAAGSTRSPLSAAGLSRAVVTGGLWSEVRVVAETGSTNADVAAAARAGAAEGLVLLAEHQRAGRGRAGRGWSSPPAAGLTMSVLLRPGARVPAVTTAHWGWLPLLAGVALAETVTDLAGVTAALKWPNDLLVDGGKCAGILTEVAGDAAVVGIGLNVTTRADELPPWSGAGRSPTTSLALAGARTTDRAVLLRGLLGRFERWYARWCAAGGDADGCGLRPAYERCCATLGQRVRILLPQGGALSGTARQIDPAGRLVVEDGGDRHVLAAGDVTHLRPIGP